MNIGLYFGTFNPIHVGHLIIANHMAEYTDLEQVWLVVSPQNPFKQKSTLLADYHRLQLVQIATEDYPKLKPSKIEFELPKPSYTINTLTYLAEKFPQHNFSLIMGEDNLNSFHKWKNYDFILENHQLYVYPRLTSVLKDGALKNHPNIHQVTAPVIEISATQIRKGIAQNKEVKPLLPCKVWQYIDEMNFYK
ncbi:MAG: nicotinate-nucleotide adenylyltransferase [Flavobacteriales bacterium]|jgi:nicotinate-nucleotide adenylyltransferase|nr:nicotinate-nucleotide adenylyltransferase [Flavobacteriales bacterium]